MKLRDLRGKRFINGSGLVNLNPAVERAAESVRRAVWLGANRSDARWHREDLQQRQTARRTCYAARSALTFWVNALRAAMR